jgi:hypothetical protein
MSPTDEKRMKLLTHEQVRRMMAVMSPEWVATPELRWRHDHMSTMYGPFTLQQKWIEIGTGEIEWRNVPQVFE